MQHDDKLTKLTAVFVDVCVCVCVCVYTLASTVSYCLSRQHLETELSDGDS